MFVYLITNRRTGKQYVGTTIRSIRQRFSDHVNCSRGHRPQALYVAMREDGIEQFSVERLHEVDTYDEMLARERDEIAARGTLAPAGYNHVKGGRGNFGWVMREETKQKIAAKALGRVAWNKGIPNSEEARRKMSLVRKGQPSTPAQLTARRQCLLKAHEGLRRYWAQRRAQLSGRALSTTAEAVADAGSLSKVG